MLTFDDLKKKQLKGNTLSTPAQSGAGAFQNTQNQSQASWNDTFNPLAWAGNFAGGAVKTVGDVANIGGGMLKGAVQEGAKTAGSVLDTALGAVKTGRDLAYGDFGEAGKDVVGMGTNILGGLGHGVNAVGNIAGAGLAAASALPASAIGGVVNFGKRAAEGILPDQTRAVEDALGGAGKGIAGALGGALSGVQNAAQGTLQSGYEGIGMDKQRAAHMAGEAIAGSSALAAGAGVVAGQGLRAVKGAGEAIRMADQLGMEANATSLAAKTYKAAAPILNQLGDSGIAKAAKSMVQDASAIMSTPKSLSGGWLDTAAQKLKQGGAWLAMKKDGVPIPENIPFKNVADTYWKNRSDAFYNTPLGDITNFAKNVAQSPVVSTAGKAAGWTAKLAYQVSPMNYGVGLTKQGAIAGYRMSKYGYDAMKKVFGSNAAKEISDVPLASDDIMRATGLAPSDQYAAMQQTKDILSTGVRDDALAAVRQKVAPLMTSVNDAVADTEGGLSTAVKAYKGYTDAVTTAGKETLKAGMGQQPAFYEGTRNILNGILTNTLDNHSSALRQEIQQMATSLGRQQTTESILQIQQRVAQMLQGKGIDPAELARNTQVLGSLHNTATNDLMMTLGHYDETLGAALVDAHNTYKGTLAQTLQNMGDRIAIAPSNAAKGSILHKEYLQPLAAHGAEVVAPLAGHVDDLAGDFFRNGAVAFHKTGMGTLLEKSPAWRTAKVAMGDEAGDMFATATHPGLTTEPSVIGNANILDHVDGKIKMVIGNTARLFNNVINEQSPRALQTFARSFNMPEELPAAAIHGDAQMLGVKRDMTKFLQESQGVDPDMQPLDIFGNVAVLQGKALDAQRIAIGNAMNQAYQDLGITHLNVKEPFDNLTADLHRVLELGTDAEGNLIPEGVSRMEGLGSKIAEVQRVFNNIQKRITPDGRMTLADVKKVDDMLEDMPGILRGSDTGQNLQTDIEKILTRYRTGVDQQLPPKILDLEADYAKTMGAQRNLYKEMGVTDKNYNERSTYIADATPDHHGIRELTTQALQSGGRNLKKILSASDTGNSSLGTWHRIFTVANGEDLGRAMTSDALNVASYNKQLTELMTGTDKPFQWVQSILTKGPVKAAGSRAAKAFTASQEKQLTALRALIEGQKAMVEKDPSRVYRTKNLFSDEYINAPQYKGLSRTYPKIEDTKQSSGYEPDTGMSQVIPDQPTTVAPGVKSANLGKIVNALPNTPPPVQSSQQQPTDNYPF